MKKIIAGIWILFGFIFFPSISYFYFSTLKESQKSLRIKGKTLLEAIFPSVKSSIKFSVEIDRNVLKELNFLSDVLLSEKVNKEDLLNYSVKFDLFGITIVDKENKVINSSFYRRGEKINKKKILKGINMEINGDTMFFCKEKNKRKILILKDISSIKLLKREYGIKSLLNEISKDPEIDFFLFQSKEGIVFSSKLPEKLIDIEKDAFLKKTLLSDTVCVREIINRNKKVIEFAKSMEIFGEKEGIIRMGLSMDRYFIFLKNLNLFLIIFMVFLGIYLTLSFLYLLSVKEHEKIKKMEKICDILQAINTPFLLTKEDGEIIFANEAAEMILKRKNLSGKNIFQLDEIDIFRINKAIQERKELKFEQKINERIFYGTVVPLTYKNSIFIFSILKDITEVKEKYREEKLSGFTEFLAGLAHEIKNPLNLLSLSISELEGELEEEKLNKLKKAYLNLKERVEDFLIYLKPFEMKKEKISLFELFKEIKEENKEILEKQKIQFQLHGEKLTLFSDYRKLKKIFSNIIKNSIEAQEEGGIIEIEIRKAENKAKVEISDRGVGISEEEIDKIFSPFYTTKKKGSGLGLFMVRKLLQDLNGNIKISSKPGFGTKVKIEIPLK